MSPYQNFKLILVEASNLSKDALHIYVGLSVMLLVVILFKKSLSDWRPLAAVAVASVAGELWDLVDTFMHRQTLRWDASWKDVWNTLFWPTTLFALARFTRVLRR